MKKLFTLVVVFTCFLGVKAEEVYKVVYSTYSSFPWYQMSFEPTWVEGIMTDTGAEAWHQYFIADGIPTVVGNNYKVRALVKSSANLNFNINMQWGWDTGQSIGKSVTIPESDDFVWVEWTYNNIGGTSCGLVAQPWSNPTIEWKELRVYTADAEYVRNYGDLYSVTPKMYAKNAGEGWGTTAVADGDGVYTVSSLDDDKAADWATQFWIATPEAGLPAGQKFYVEFDFKADHDAKVSTQTQLEENGGYKTYYCVGEGDSKSDINFTNEWKSIKKEVTIENDMEGWRSIAFNLNIDKTANKYYFRNIALKVPELISEEIDFCVGAAGWATYSSNYNVSLGSTKGYKAHYNGSNVELSPVTEVPADNAIIVEEAGKHAFTVVASAAAITDNDLKVSDGKVTSDGTIYALGNKAGVGFYKVKSGQTIPAGKAYLEIPAGSPAPEFLSFDFGGEMTTGVKAIDNVQVAKDNVFYNLAGQRVAQPKKGLYIVNGKTVVVK